MKKINVILLSLLFIFFSTSSVSAYFYRDHVYFIINEFYQSDSAMAAQCRPYLESVINGVQAADCGVIHYFDDKVTAYIGSHQRQGYDRCLEEAGTDLESKCFCYGMGLHITEDALSHLGEEFEGGGVVFQNIKKALASNFIGHMVVERSYEIKHQKYLEERNDRAITSGDLDYYDDRTLNLMFEFDSEGNEIRPSKYMDL